MELPNWNKERPDWDIYFMLQAEIAKLRSNCLTRRIGCVIVKDNRQISTGYNGTPPGITNCIDGGCPRCMTRLMGEIKSGDGLERCLCTHAEANAIMQCTLYGNAGTTKGATLYSTFVPCLECSKMIITVGIKKVIAMFNYPEDGKSLLTEAGVELKIINQQCLNPWILVLQHDMLSSTTN